MHYRFYPSFFVFLLTILLNKKTKGGIILRNLIEFKYAHATKLLKFLLLRCELTLSTYPSFERRNED